MTKSFYGLETDKYFSIAQCYDRIFVPNHKMPVIHKHFGFEIMYILYGKVCVNVYNNEDEKKIMANESSYKSWNLYPGDFIFLESRLYHDIKVGEKGARILNLEVRQINEPSYPKQNTLKRILESDNDINDFYQLEPGTFRLYDETDILRILSIIISRFLDQKTNDIFTDMLFNALFADIIKLYLKNNNSYRGHSYVRTAVFIIENCMGNISSDQLAKQVGISAIYMRLLFKKCFNQSVFEYINYYKIKRGCSRIRNNSNIILSELAKELGFGSLQSFERVFKRIKGCTPAKYREDMEKSRNVSISPYQDHFDLTRI